MKLRDLHAHSIFSDGTLSPEQLIDLAIEVGLTAVALTDHNIAVGIGLLMTIQITNCRQSYCSALSAVLYFI